MRVVITGGTGALGASVVAACLERGFEVHLPIVEPALPGHLAWRANDRVHPQQLSLDDEAQVVKFYGELPDLWASIHLVGGFAMAEIGSTSLAVFETQWRLNAVTCFLACREAVRTMRRGKQGGRIVNVAARPVLTPAASMIAYTAAKASVAALTQSLATEVLAEGILVNAVVPSIIDSLASRASMPTADHTTWPKPEQLSETIMFLASPQNALTSGALVPVYGHA